MPQLCRQYLTHATISNNKVPFSVPLLQRNARSGFRKEHEFHGRPNELWKHFVIWCLFFLETMESWFIDMLKCQVNRNAAIHAPLSEKRLSSSVLWCVILLSCTSIVSSLRVHVVLFQIVLSVVFLDNMKFTSNLFLVFLFSNTTQDWTTRLALNWAASSTTKRCFFFVPFAPVFFFFFFSNSIFPSSLVASVFPSAETELAMIFSCVKAQTKKCPMK